MFNFGDKVKHISYAFTCTVVRVYEHPVMGGEMVDIMSPNRKVLPVRPALLVKA